MFAFALSASESLSIAAVPAFAIVSHSLSEQYPAVIRRSLLAFVGLGLLSWLLLVVSAILDPLVDPWHTVHAAAGWVILPLVACATATWFGSSLPKVKRKPIKTLCSCVLLVLLCLFCYSNARTGFLGPSRIDPELDRKTNIRFDVLHRMALPSYIGLVLFVWFWRLAFIRVATIRNCESQVDTVGTSTPITALQSIAPGRDRDEQGPK